MCPDVPARELEQLTFRLAWLQAAADTPEPVDAPDDATPVAATNKVVWLPGSPGAAVVWPAGEESARRVPTLVELKAFAERHAGTARALHARGRLALRQAREAILEAYEAHARAGLPDR